MIGAINFWGKKEVPGTLSNVSAARKAANSEKTNFENRKSEDSFERASSQKEKSPKVDNNDKFEKQVK